jgi:hypothetical protein
MPRIALNPNESAASTNNAVYDGQAESRTFAFRFRREEWIEDSGHLFRGYSLPRVFNHNFNEFVDRASAYLAPVAFTDWYGLSLDHEFASVWHGVASIHGEIEKHLAEYHVVAMIHRAAQVQNGLSSLFRGKPLVGAGVGVC